MTDHQMLTKFKDFAETVKLWQYEMDEIHALELALSQALAKGAYDIKDFAPALAAIHDRAYRLTEKINTITDENIALVEKELQNAD